jgi:predicted dehydrogenase
MPKAVFADIRKVRTNTQVDDFFEVILYYDSVRVSLKASYLVKEPGPRYLIHGTNGSFVKYGIDPQEDELKAGNTPLSKNWGTDIEANWGILHVESDGKSIKEKIKTIPGNYLTYYENIYDVIRNYGELAVKPEEGLNVIRIIEAAMESSKTRTVVNVI